VILDGNVDWGLETLRICCGSPLELENRSGLSWTKLEGKKYHPNSREGEIGCSKTMGIEKSKEVGSIRSCIYYVIIIDYILRTNLQRCNR